MRIEVSEDALWAGAATVARAAALVASLDLDHVTTSVALAMPGSRSAGGAAEMVGVLGEVAATLARDLSVHADALRLAGVEYDDADRDVAVSERDARQGLPRLHQGERGAA